MFGQQICRNIFITLSNIRDKRSVVKKKTAEQFSKEIMFAWSRFSFALRLTSGLLRDEFLTKSDQIKRSATYK